MTYLTAVWDVWLELAPWLLLGTTIASALHVLLPADFVHRHLGGRGTGSVVKAVLLGVPMPLCSCGVIPAGLALKKDGASDGAAVGFLISTPQTGVDSILVSASFLGWPFAVFKVIAAAVTGIVGGAIADLGDTTALPSAPQPQVQSRGGFQEAWFYAVDELLYPIWRWLVFGVLLSAAITTFIPPGALAGTVAGVGVAAMLGALVISLPLYVCATSSVPIAASLVHAGLPAGAALVFLMAGPASNVATIGAVHKAFGRRVLAIYLATIAAGSVAFGLLFDAFYQLDVSAAFSAHDHAGPVAIGSAIALLVLIGWYTLSDLKTLAQRMSSASGEEVVLSVHGMTCNGCVRKVISGLSGTDGVDTVLVDLEAKTATIRGASLQRPDLEEAVRKAGFRIHP